MQKQLITHLTAACFIIVWTYAAASKLGNLNAFHGQLAQSPLILNYARLLKWAVPIIELVLALGLLIKPFQEIAMIGSTFLMMSFCWYIIAITQFSTYIPCSCGGLLQQLSWNQHLLLNTVLVIGGCWSIIAYAVPKPAQ